MISEFILNMVFGVLTVFLELLPDITIDVDTSLFSFFMDFLSMVFYLLPMDTVITIAYIVISLTVFRIVIAFIKTVWDMLPLV